MKVNIFYQTDIPKYLHRTGLFQTACLKALKNFRQERAEVNIVFVDEKEIWQCVDDGNVAWHCGGASKYYNDCRNGNSIGVEMCCKKDSDGNLYIDKQTIQNTIELVQYLMKQYGIDINHVVRHYDVTHKVCPAPFVEDENLWVDFKRRISMKEITDIKEALDYLEEKGRLTNRAYWEKAITCVRNQEFVFIKWANDLKTLLG